MHDAHAHAEQRAVAVRCELDVVHLFAFVHGRAEVFEPVLDPLDRALERAGGERYQHFFGIEDDLGPEAAADVGRDHVQLVFGHVEGRRHQAARDVR